MTLISALTFGMGSPASAGFVLAGVNRHPAAAAIAAFFIFSNAVGAMEKPDASSSKFYRWLYGFAHATAGNGLYALRLFFPQFKLPDWATKGNNPQ